MVNGSPSAGWTLDSAPNPGTIAPTMGAPADSLATALFGKTRRNVLGLLLLDAETNLHLREIVRRTGGGQGAVQRELEHLCAAGIVRREGQARAITYRANADSPVFDELRRLLAKTVGVAEQLRRALAPLQPAIEIAFIYGSYARESELRAGSDIDLMVIGTASFGDVVEHTAAVQNALGREVNPTVYTPAEYSQRVRDGHHFLTDVTKQPKLFLIGSAYELERLGDVRVGDSPRADARRDTRAAGRRRS